MTHFERIQISAVFRAAIFVSVALTLGLIARSQLVTSSDLLATAVAIDLVVTLPVIYLLLIRKSSVPKTTVVPVFVACTLAASILLPDSQTEFLKIIATYAIPVAEVVVIGYLGFRIYRTRAAFLAEQGAGRDLMERLRNAFVRELKPEFVARAAAFEISTLILAFWGQRRPEGVTFTYHRRDSPRTLLGVFMGLLVAETAVVHILVAMWSPIVAWLATAASVYLLIQMIAHFRGVSSRPITVTKESLFIRCGILGDLEVDLKLVDSVKHISERGTGDIFELGTLGPLTQANVFIEFTRPVAVYKPFGSVSNVQRIAIAVDEPESLREILLRP